MNGWVKTQTEGWINLTYVVQAHLTNENELELEFSTKRGDRWITVFDPSDKNLIIELLDYLSDRARNQ